MKTDTQLTLEQRYQIYILMKARHSQTEIADLIGVNKSKRLANSESVYLPLAASSAPLALKSGE